MVKWVPSSRGWRSSIISAWFEKREATILFIVLGRQVILKTKPLINSSIQTIGRSQIGQTYSIGRGQVLERVLVVAFRVRHDGKISSLP